MYNHISNIQTETYLALKEFWSPSKERCHPHPAGAWQQCERHAKKVVMQRNIPEHASIVCTKFPSMTAQQRHYRFLTFAHHQTPNAPVPFQAAQFFTKHA